jgi:signal transduction histidine kinase
MQLMSNLVDNAIRQYRPGGHFGAQRRQVIPPVEQKAIFDPLRRGMHQDQAQPPSGGYGTSLGIGLYIAQQIAAAHGGGIQVSSTRTGGTRVVAVLGRHFKAWIAPR